MHICQTIKTFTLWRSIAVKSKYALRRPPVKLLSVVEVLIFQHHLMQVFITKILTPAVALLLSAATYAQSHAILNEKDIWGDSVTTYKNTSGIITLKVVENTDIFGNQTTSYIDTNGKTIKSVKKSTDIFGNKTVDISKNGQQVGSIKQTTNIFGDQEINFTGAYGENIKSIKNLLILMVIILSSHMSMARR